MKNNQFRAYIDKYVKKKYEYTTVLTVDLDSNRRVMYLYGKITNECLGTISLNFANEFVEIQYSKSAKSAVSICNKKEKGKFDYCELKQAIELIDKAIKYFAEGGRYE